MTQQEFVDIQYRFSHGQCLPADMDALLNAMAEAPPEGYATWRMVRLEKGGIIRRVASSIKEGFMDMCEAGNG